MFNKPTCVIMVGLPGCGKSTYRNKYLRELIICSTDDYIEQYAAEKGLTYNDVFKSIVSEATTEMYNTMDICIRLNQSFVVDQTNLSVNKRASILRKLPSHYRKIAIVFNSPFWGECPLSVNEWQKRLASRSGKTIPMNVMNSMIDNYQHPSYNEAFDEIWSVR